MSKRGFFCSLNWMLNVWCHYRSAICTNVNLLHVMYSEYILKDVEKLYINIHILLTVFNILSDNHSKATCTRYSNPALSFYTCSFRQLYISMQNFNFRMKEPCAI